MILIGKSKIAEYVFNNPESGPSLLNWLKEYPYRPVPINREGIGFGKSGWSPDCGDYKILLSINYTLAVECITWVGSKEEFQKKMELNLEESRKQGHKVELRTITTQVVLAPPPPVRFNESSTIASDTTMQPPMPAEELSPYLSSANNVSNRSYLQTLDKYHDVLVKIEHIIEAALGSPEFDKLANLIILAKEYEENKLEFPVLKIHELMAYRMNMLDLVPSNLTLIASEEELNEFLAGRALLPSAAISKFYKFVGIKYPVTDHRFL